MIKTKNFFICFLLLALVFVLVSCKKEELQEHKILSNLIGNDNLKSHQTRLYDFETPYTLCFKNSDGSISMYIFSSPISYKDKNESLKLINSSFSSDVNSDYKDQGYILQSSSGNTVSYYPNSLTAAPIIVQDEQTVISFNVEDIYKGNKYQKTIYTDIIGREHDSISYLSNNVLDIKFVPTSTGTTVSLVFKEHPSTNKISFYIDKHPDTVFSIFNKNTVIMTQGVNSSVGILRSSFLTDATGAVNFNSFVSLEELEQTIKYTIELDNAFLSDANNNYPMTFSASFDILPNSLLNISNYSERPNDILSNYSFVGTSDYFGEGVLYMKFRIGYFVKSYEQNIKKATYSFVNLGGSDTSLIEFHRLKGFWNDDISDKNFPQVTFKESDISINGLGTYTADITNYIKACIYDDTLNTEDYGLLVCNNNNNTKILSNYNNSLYKPYVRIDFFDMPWTFENIDKMNP